MIIACPCGKKKFEVNSSLIPSEGKMLQCGTCSEKWFFKKEIKKEPKILHKNHFLFVKNLNIYLVKLSAYDFFTNFLFFGLIKSKSISFFFA